jgi:hypothetical protein
MAKTRKVAKQTSYGNRKVYPECAKLLAETKSSPKSKVVLTVYGNKAVSAAQELLFQSSADAEKWAKTWSAAEQKKAMLFVFVRKLKKNSVIGFKFYIPHRKDFSVVGEEHPYKEGLAKLRTVFQEPSLKL